MSIRASTAAMIFNPEELVKSNDDKFQDQSSALKIEQGATTARVAVFSKDYSSYQSSEDPELIQKLFKALKVDIEDVCLIDIEKSEVNSWKNISPILESEYVLIFGLVPKDLGMNLRILKNRWLPFSDKHLIFTDELSKMAADKELKLPFWNALKPVFIS